MKTAHDYRTPILEYCRKRRSPILIGRALMEARVQASLDEIETVMEDLTAEGILRHLTRDECRNFGISFGYALV